VRRRAHAYTPGCAARLAASATASKPTLTLHALPPGYEYFTDTIDGYSLLYPADWVQVRARGYCLLPRSLALAGPDARTLAAPQTAGADVFFRGPLKVEENLFVEARAQPRTCAASPHAVAAYPLRLR
jgi:hypothetical protein